MRRNRRIKLVKSNFVRKIQMLCITTTIFAYWKINLMISQLDAMILRELLYDGRKSSAEIAKELRTTKDVVWKRCKDMEKNQIITGATIQFNYPCFGYESIATVCLNVTSDYLNTVLGNLRRIPDVSAWQIYGSAFNIMVITLFRSLKELDNIKSMLKTNPVNAVKTYLWTDVRNTPENLTFGFPPEKLNKIKVMKIKKERALKIDTVDYQLIEQLNMDGRMPFRKVGEIIGASTDTVSRRYSKLLRNGYIKTIVQVNPIAVGYQGIVTFFLSIVSKENIEKAIDEIGRIPNVSYITKLSGDHELQFAFLFRHFDELIGINKKILLLPGIEKIDTTFREAPPFWPGPKQFITTF